MAKTDFFFKIDVVKVDCIYFGYISGQSKCSVLICINVKITKTLVVSQVRKHFHVKAAKCILGSVI